jgi:hypothetical protein
MEIFYIPFKPDAKDGWKVQIPKDGEKQFVSRKVAKQAVSEQSESSYLCVEGGDKKWRLFTPDLKPVE